MDQKKIGKFIAELRKEQKMTQEQLAEKLYVDRTTISKWELGENNINIEVLLQIATMFNVSINELIIGERQNQDNLCEINSVTVNILKKNKRILRYLMYSCIFIAILLLTFLSYYFISNYNSIMVYEIHGESNEFLIHNGLMMVSKDVSYIQLGNVKSLGNNNIESIKLFYKKDNKSIDLYEVNDASCFYILKYNNSPMKYSDIRYLLPNIFLEVKFDNGNVSQIKLQLKKLYSNNKLYNNLETIKQEEVNNLNTEIPKYVKNNFSFDENSKSYYLEQKIDNKKIKQTYFYEMNVYVVEEIYKNYSERYTYSSPDDFSYSKLFENGETENEFYYSLKNNECIMGNCINDIIDYFENQYLSVIKEN